ncbi:hypothetical protein GCM10028822_35060 [Hymenobacter terrigena]
MLRNTFSFFLAALLAGAFLGCKKDCATPAPSCYSGKVVAYTCMMGPLIEVDAAYPIGARAVSIAGNRFLGNNVIAVANPASLRNISQVGQVLYFTYTPASTPAVAACLAADGTTTPVPILSLSNVSTISCDSARAK